jgi:RNA polymerase sigma-70 factor, ECF subfamily
MRQDRFRHKSDEQLLTDARHDPEAFGTFYCRHEKAMLLYFLRRTGRAEVAADLTAEVFAAALESSKRFRPGKAPAAAWLYGIAKNKLAASQARGRVEERARKKLGTEPLLLTDEAIERVEQLADQAQEAEILGRLLDGLPAHQQEAIRQHVLEGLSYDELSTELRCSEAVVRQRVSRGLRSLRLQLKESA